MIEPELNNSSEFLAFKQRYEEKRREERVGMSLSQITLPHHVLLNLSSLRKREVQLAVNLVAKLSNYSLAEKEAFTQKVQAECVELSGKVKGGNIEGDSICGNRECAR
jgi:hypothetical protein